MLLDFWLTEILTATTVESKNIIGSNLPVKVVSFVRFYDFGVLLSF